MLDSKIPPGDLANKWSDYKSKVPLVSPANKLNIDLNLRPQNLDFETYYKLTSEYEKLSC